MADVFQPRSEAEVAEFVRSANAGGYPLEVCGFRSKRQAGRPVVPSAVLSTARLTGITYYKPDELVVSAWAGTPFHELEAELAKRGQELAFEPADWSRIYTREPHAGTVGGVAAANISGQRRILRGASRDFLLGLKAVNGMGEIIRTGGRVMKNVTGVDLVRGLSSSWGTLAVVTEVTYKVLPKARESHTLLYHNLPDESAIGLLCAAMGTPYEVSGTLHLHGPMVARLVDPSIAPANSTLTALRLEGEGEFLEARVDALRRLLHPFGQSHDLEGRQSRAFWQDIRSLSFLSAEFEKPLWRITVAPSQGPILVRALSQFFPVQAAYEWSGGLVWVETPPSRDAHATEIRRVLSDMKGDAMLVRAPREVRETIEVFHPQPLATMRLVEGIKRAFDPGRILNPGRMYAHV